MDHQSSTPHNNGSSSFTHSSNPQEEMPRILQALSAVFSTPSTTTNTTTTTNLQQKQEREQADKYLTSFQKSTVAWHVCDLLLSQTTAQLDACSLSSLAPQIYFFAAQTLHSKCQIDILQLVAMDGDDGSNNNNTAAGNNNNNNANGADMGGGGFAGNQRSGSNSRRDAMSPTMIKLRDSLMDHLSRFCALRASSSSSSSPSSSSSLFQQQSTTNNGLTTASSISPIITRLAMTLCALSVQMQWTSIVDHILQILQQDTNGSTTTQDQHTEQEFNKLQFVLELCQLLPEETQSKRLLVMDEMEYREVFWTVLREQSQKILEFLMYCVQMVQMTTTKQNNGSTTTSTTTSISSQNIIKIQESILQCLHSWIRHVDIPPSLLQGTPLLDWVLEILHHPPLFDSTSSLEQQRQPIVSTFHVQVEGDMFELAVDTIIELLRCYPSNAQIVNGVMKNMELIQKMIPYCMALGSVPTVETSPFQRSIRQEDEDTMRGYCRIFTEMGESYMSLIMSNENLNQRVLVDLVLGCSGLPDNEIASITLNFWYRFVANLEDLQPYEFRQIQVDKYTPQLVQLISTCTTLLQYPEDIDTYPPDRMDDIERERSYVSDTLEDCCRLLGGDMVFKTIYTKLQEVCHGLSTSTSDRSKQWQGIESCLCALISTSRYVSNDENEILPFVMSMIITDLPTDVTLLRTTVNHLIGNYVLWLNAHAEYLQRLLPYLAQGLSEPKCASSAAIAIRRLCESCSSKFALGESSLQLYESIVDAMIKQHQQQQPRVLHLRDELEVLEGCCKAVSRQCEEARLGLGSASTETVSQYANRIVNPIGTRLVSYADVNSPATPRQVSEEIGRLTVVVRFLHIPITLTDDSNSVTMVSPRSQFLIDLMKNLWASLDEVAKRFSSDINLAEKICRLHKHVLRTCGAIAYQSLLPTLRNSLTQNYAQSRQSPYLYAASVCVVEYGKKNDTMAEHAKLLQQMLMDMSNTTFTFLRSMDDFISYPDIVEELFFLADRMVKYCPYPFVSNSMLYSFFKCAAVGMKLDHKDANRGIISFLENTISFGIDLQQIEKGHVDFGCKECLEQVIVSEGQQIVINLIKAIVGDLPCYRLTHHDGSVAGVLYKLSTLCPQLLISWLNDPSLTKLIPKTAESKFVNAFKMPIYRDEFFDSVANLARLCDRSRKMLGA